jgi:hypothetical protein
MLFVPALCGVMFLGCGAEPAPTDALEQESASLSDTYPFVLSPRSAEDAQALAELATRLNQEFGDWRPDRALDVAQGMVRALGDRLSRLARVRSAEGRAAMSNFAERLVYPGEQLSTILSELVRRLSTDDADEVRAWLASGNQNVSKARSRTLPCSP